MSYQKVKGQRDVIRASYIGTAAPYTRASHSEHSSSALADTHTGTTLYLEAARRAEVVRGFAEKNKDITG